MKREVTIKFGSVGFVIWLGIGILYHLLTSDIPFSWADPWLYVTMALWPIFLLGWILLAFVIFLVGLVGIWYYQTVRDEKRRRNLPKNKLARERMEKHRQKTTLPHHRK